jgi:hypothetical protein
VNDHKPTFKPSPTQRPLIQRLTPVAWAFVGIVALAMLLGIAGCVMTLTGHPTEEPWDPTATTAPTPTAISVPTAGPSPSPTAWYEEIVTPTAAATEVVTAAYPAWWSDQMTQDEEGNWWPPEEVDAMVKEHFHASMRAYERAFPEGSVPDLNALESMYPTWYSGPQLEQQLLSLEAKRRGERLFWQTDYERLHLEIQSWSADGMECTLGVTLQGIETQGYDLDGQLVEAVQDESKLILWRMRYDPVDGHWKINELVDFYD